MSGESLKQRIKRIQSRLGVTADGLIGPVTLTAIENRLFEDLGENIHVNNFSLVVTQKGLKQLVKHEISSKAYYTKFLSNPTWPGGRSGVTIGIGYDLGYNSRQQIRKDWGPRLTDLDLEKLLVVAGLSGNTARQSLVGVKDVFIPIEAARSVFYKSTLGRFARLTRRTWPGVEDLYADAQAALLSLVYNRGASLSGSSRKEMKNIKRLVVEKDYAGISREILSMKRLWENKGLDGLLKRREDEARMVRLAHREYDDDELIRV